MKLDVTIREAKIADVPFLGEAQREIAKEPGLFCSEPSEITDKQTETMISSFLQSKNGVFLVAEYKGQIVGHAYLDPLSIKTISHVAELGVIIHLDWQGKGVGTQLIKALIAWAENHAHIEKIELHVRASNTRAIALYKKLGFQEEGRLKKRVKIGERYIDDLIMALLIK